MVRIRVTRETWNPLVGAALATFGVTHEPPVLNHALLAAVTLFLALIYRFGPSRARPKWRWVSWGSAFAAVSWVLGSAAFSWYVANFGSYNKTYGSLGAVVGFMTWIWTSTIIVLVGGELNAEMEHQTERDTTVGPEVQPGLRRATKADRVVAS